MENKERWMELCAQAAKEQDPERLFELVQEINTLLDEKEARLKNSRLTLRVDTSEGQNPKGGKTSQDPEGRGNLKQPQQPIHPVISEQA